MSTTTQPPLNARVFGAHGQLRPARTDLERKEAREAAQLIRAANKLLIKQRYAANRARGWKPRAPKRPPTYPELSTTTIEYARAFRHT